MSSVADELHARAVRPGGPFPGPNAQAGRLPYLGRWLLSAGCWALSGCATANPPDTTAKACLVVAVRDGRVWAGYPDRCEVWQAAGPDQPARQLSTVRLPAVPRQFIPLGDSALACCGEAGAAVLASSTTYPTWCAVPPPALAATVRNGLLAVAAGTNGVWLLSVTNPAAPTLLGGFPGATDARDVGFIASLVCVADGTNGLKFLDVSTPAQPEMVGLYAPPGGPPADALAISTTLIVTAHDRHLRLLDASDPRQPVVMATHELPAPCLGLALSKLRLWVACGEAGVVELDLIHALKELARHPTRGPAHAVAAEGSRVFVAEGEAGWRELPSPPR